MRSWIQARCLYRYRRCGSPRLAGCRFRPVDGAQFGYELRGPRQSCEFGAWFGHDCATRIDLAEPCDKLMRMKYRRNIIPETYSQLRIAIIDTMMRSPSRKFPDGYDFDGAYRVLERGVEKLRKRFGDAKADQLLDMIRQAKTHHECGDTLGSRLLQDVEMLVANRRPYAYPKELYRWSSNPGSPISKAAR